MASMKFQPHMLVQCVPSIRSRQNAKNMLFVAICKSHLRAPNKIISIHPSIYLSTYPILSYPTLSYPIPSYPILSIYTYDNDIYIYIYTYIHIHIHIYIYIYLFIDLCVYFLTRKAAVTITNSCASLRFGSTPRRTQKVLREQRSL